MTDQPRMLWVRPSDVQEGRWIGYDKPDQDDPEVETPYINITKFLQVRAELSAAHRALVDIRDSGRWGWKQTAASRRAQAAIEVITEMSPPSSNGANGGRDEAQA